MERLIYGHNKKIYDTIIADVKGMGFDIVRILYTPNPKNSRSRETLQIMIERMDSKPIIVEDCEKVSRTLSFILEVEDIISDRYSLEVSSAGIDRPLTRIKDFKESVGLLTKFTFAAPVNNVSKNVKATIVSADDEEVVISYEEYQAAVKYDNITKAKLVLTDELIENAKNAQECETNNIEDKNV